MSIGTPFTPTINPTSGNTVGLIATSVSVSGSINCSVQNANNILVTNGGAAIAFVRMSTEAHPVATTLDIPLVGSASRVFANPAPQGTVGLAVISGGTVYFTPGEGGI